MSVLPRELEKVIQEFERRSEPFSDHDVEEEIRKAINTYKNEGGETTYEFSAELMAFDFSEDYQNEETGWGTYYGPMAIFKKDDQWVESPSIQLVTPEILDYWQTRSQETTHPLLQNRYADLVWDFSPKICSRTADISCAHSVIDSAIKYSIEKLYDHRIKGKKKLARAMSIALSTNDKKRITKVVEAIIQFEGNDSEGDNDMAWDFAFDLLVNNKNHLTDDQRQRIIDGLEGVLANVAYDDDENNIDPFQAEDTAIRLAEFYRKQNRLDDVQRVLRQYANTFVVVAKKATALLAVTWLRKVYDNLMRFNLKDEAENIAVMMREKGAKTKDEMAHASHKIEFTQEEIEGYLSEMMKGDNEQVTYRLVETFIPNSLEVEKQLQDLAKKNLLWGVFGHAMVDENGREISRVGSMHEDLEGRIVALMSQNMQIEAMLLNLSIKEWIKRFCVTAGTFADLLLKSPVFQNERRSMLQKGLQAYIDGDYLSAVHILIPQIEQALRQLLVITGQNTYKPGRHGGLNLKMLDDLLREAVVKNVFDDDVVKYLKVLLTDPRGWNLRNNICHGIIIVPEQNPTLIDRIIHTLLLLSKVQKKQNSSTDAVDETKGTS